MSKSQLKFGSIDLMLLLGCLGAAEIILTFLFWETIIHNDALAFLRPRELAQKLAIFSVVIGIAGLFNYVTGIFTESIRNYIPRIILVVTFIIGFMFVCYIQFWI